MSSAFAAVGLEGDDPAARKPEGRVHGEVADVRAEVEDRRRSPEVGEKGRNGGRRLVLALVEDLAERRDVRRRVTDVHDRP